MPFLASAGEGLKTFYYNQTAPIELRSGSTQVFQVTIQMPTTGQPFDITYGCHLLAKARGALLPNGARLQVTATDQNGVVIGSGVFGAIGNPTAVAAGQTIWQVNNGGSSAGSPDQGAYRNSQRVTLTCTVNVMTPIALGDVDLVPTRPDANPVVTAKVAVTVSTVQPNISNNANASQVPGSLQPAGVWTPGTPATEP